MPYTIPNAGVANYPPQAQIFQTDLDILTMGLGNSGVLNGCAITTTGAANNGVTVAVGAIVVNGVGATVATGTVTLSAPDGTNPRIDLVWADNTGTKGKTDGTAASAPVAPDLPANTVVLAFVYSPAAGGNTVSSTWITDKRVLLQNAILATASNQAIVAAANTLVDITGASFPMLSGKTYHFYFFGLYDVTVTTSGSRWTVNNTGGTPTFLAYSSTYGLTATTVTTNGQLTAVQLPAASNATSSISNGGGNLIQIEGMVIPSADGVFSIQGAREVTTDTLTLLAGALLRYEQLT